MELVKIMSLLSGTQITPFYQEITALRTKISNMTSKAVSLKTKVDGLDMLWGTLGQKIELFMKTLDKTLLLKMDTMTECGNQIIVIHNQTMFRYYEIHQILINDYLLLKNTVQARMQQQHEALEMLRRLGAEMTGYLNTATSAASSAMTRKYDFMQKIRLSYEAAQTAVQSATRIRSEAFNLTSRLTPVNARAIEVKVYAQGCVGSIDAWLKNATSTLVYAQGVLRMIEITLPDNSQVRKFISLNYDFFLSIKPLELGYNIQTKALNIQPVCIFHVQIWILWLFSKTFRASLCLTVINSVVY